jgi:hypothetical protein
MDMGEVRGGEREGESGKVRKWEVGKRIRSE